jgi:hypothetical protein
MRASFHEWDPLYVYLNVSSAKNANSSVQFELRYLGQTVAKLIRNKKTPPILSTTGFDNLNRDYFGCKISLKDDWTGEESLKFRRFFKTREDKSGNGAKRNEEHRLQSMLLTEFSKAKDKTILGIKPVTICGVRFPMPTPLSASNHTHISYSEVHGGGIDILARIGTGGKSTRICIMELKDENNSKEPPLDVMKQAIVYTTFIHELLRSNTGPSWWTLFGFKQSIPEHLELFAACVMPSGKSNVRFDDICLDVGNDKIKLGQLYFDDTKGGLNMNIPESNLGQYVRFKESFDLKHL